MSNTSRIVQELVSLEAWHSRFEIDCESPFHIAVAFSQARYSGGERSPVEFRVRLKRATLIVICDDNLHVPKSSKVRRYPERIRTLTSKDQSGIVSKEQSEWSKTSEAQAKIGTSPSVAGRGKAEDKAALVEENADQSSREVVESLSQTIHMTYREVSGEHHWDLEPVLETHLKGHANDGADPIMRLRPKVGSRLEDLGIRVFVQCKADDLDITDIDAKPNLKERMLGEDLERRLRMAKEVIKLKLSEAELDVVELEPKFQDVLLADILAMPE